MIAIIVVTVVFHGLPIPTLRPAYVEHGGYIVVSPDAHFVRGGSVRYDPVRKVASIEMLPPRALGTPAPYDRTAPRPVPSGVPRPRRTPVSVIPSYPAPART